MRQSDRERLNKRSQIIEAAERCFIRKGFHQTSMQDICAEAGMSAGNLYRYFPSKEAIIEAFAASELAWLKQAIEDVPSSPDMLQAILDTFFWCAATLLVDGKPELTAELFAESGRNPSVNAIYVAFNRRLAEEIGAVLRTAERHDVIAPPHDAASVARIFISLVDGLVMQSIVDPDLDPMKLRPALETMLKGLLRPQAKGEPAP
jgi:AcrR family transcriptional regulator